MCHIIYRYFVSVYGECMWITSLFSRVVVADTRKHCITELISKLQIHFRLCGWGCQCRFSCIPTLPLPFVFKMWVVFPSLQIRCMTSTKCPLTVNHVAY